MLVKGTSYHGGCATHVSPVQWVKKPKGLNPGNNATWSLKYAKSDKVCDEAVVIMFQALDNKKLAYDTCILTFFSGQAGAFPGISMNCLNKTLKLAYTHNLNPNEPRFPQFKSTVVDANPKP